MFPLDLYTWSFSTETQLILSFFFFLNYCSWVWLPVVMAWIMFIFWKDGLFHLPFLLPSNMQLRSKSSFFFFPLKGIFSSDQNSGVLRKHINEQVTSLILAFLRLLNFLMLSLVIFGLKIRIMTSTCNIVYETWQWCFKGTGNMEETVLSTYIERSRYKHSTVSTTSSCHRFCMFCIETSRLYSSHWTKLPQ